MVVPTVQNWGQGGGGNVRQHFPIHPAQRGDVRGARRAVVEIVRTMCGSVDLAAGVVPSPYGDQGMYSGKAMLNAYDKACTQLKDRLAEVKDNDCSHARPVYLDIKATLTSILSWVRGHIHLEPTADGQERRVHFDHLHLVASGVQSTGVQAQEAALIKEACGLEAPEVPIQDIANLKLLQVALDRLRDMTPGHGQGGRGPGRNWCSLHGALFPAGHEAIMNFYNGLVYPQQVLPNLANRDDDNNPNPNTITVVTPDVPLRPPDVLLLDIATRQQGVQFEGAPLTLVRVSDDGAVASVRINLEPRYVDTDAVESYQDLVQVRVALPMDKLIKSGVWPQPAEGLLVYVQGLCNNRLQRRNPIIPCRLSGDQLRQWMEQGMLFEPLEAV